MVLAIECDGATYHSSATARDRDRLRQEHLERLGWTFHRIWSQDWFYHREEETERAVAAYQKAVDAAEKRERQQASNAAEHADDQTESSITALRPTTRRLGSCPILTHRGTIDDYSLVELAALVDWIESDTLLRTEDQLLVEMMLVLGFQRRGSKITSALTSAIAWARRSR